MPHEHTLKLTKSLQVTYFGSHLPDHWRFFTAVFWFNALLVAFIFSLTAAEWFTNVEVTGWLSPYFWWIYLISLAGVEFLTATALLLYTYYFKYKKGLPLFVRGYFGDAYAGVWCISAMVNTFLFGFAYDLYVDCISGKGFFAGSNIELGVAYDANVSTCYARTNIINMAIIIASGALLVWYVIARYHLWNDPHMFMSDAEIANMQMPGEGGIDAKKPSGSRHIKILGASTKF